MECNCARKFTEGLLRKYSTLWRHKCESPITVLKILYTLAGGPPISWGPKLQPIESIGKSGTECIWCTVNLALSASDAQLINVIPNTRRPHLISYLRYISFAHYADYITQMQDSQYTTLIIRERPFNLKGVRGYGFFFLKKNILIPNVAEKIFWFSWREKKSDS